MAATKQPIRLSSTSPQQAIRRLLPGDRVGAARRNEDRMISMRASWLAVNLALFGVTVRIWHMLLLKEHLDVEDGGGRGRSRLAGSSESSPALGWIRRSLGSVFFTFAPQKSRLLTNLQVLCLRQVPPGRSHG